MASPYPCGPNFFMKPPHDPTITTKDRIALDNLGVLVYQGFLSHDNCTIRDESQLADMAK